MVAYVAFTDKLVNTQLRVKWRGAMVTLKRWPCDVGLYRY